MSSDVGSREDSGRRQVGDAVHLSSPRGDVSSPGCLDETGLATQRRKTYATPVRTTCQRVELDSESFPRENSDPLYCGKGSTAPPVAADTATYTKSSETKNEVPFGAADYRHPLYLGAWERSTTACQTDFARDELDEPHLKRKLKILEKYPGVTALYGVEPLTKWISLATVMAQLFLAYGFGHWWRDQPVWVTLLVAYAVGGTITQIYGVIMHEISHDLAFKSTLANRLLGLLVNTPMPFPIAMSFRRYHLEHHTYQGVEGRDPDLPLWWEIKLVRGGGTLLKTVWLFFYPLMYVVRGAVMAKPITRWELINAGYTIICNILLLVLCGSGCLRYLFFSLWFGYGIHPAAAHFIQEHYTFGDGQETYSYYGSGNKLMLNLGFHNEHHDFLRVPWSRLPKVKSLAPEFYDTLGYHTSWFAVIRDFLFQREFGPQSRVVRDPDGHTTGRNLIRRARRCQ